MKWFKHDSMANMDAKLEKILMKYGADGYAIYWYCLELIASKIEKKNYTFELEHDAELIGHRLKIDQIRVEEIMKYMVSINLFQVNPETKRIMCIQMANRLDDSTLKNEEIRTAIARLREAGTLGNRNEYIYLMESQGKYKIGRAKNVERRLMDARAFDPKIELIHTIKTSDNVLFERKLHEHFKNQRVDGEWFNLSKEDVKYICSLNYINDISFRNFPKLSETFCTEEKRLEEIRIEEDKRPQTHTFKKPVVEDVRTYCHERKNKIDATAFLDFYESKGWMIGKNKMKDWKAGVPT